MQNAAAETDNVIIQQLRSSSSSNRGSATSVITRPTVGCYYPPRVRLIAWLLSADIRCTRYHRHHPPVVAVVVPGTIVRYSPIYSFTRRHFASKLISRAALCFIFPSFFCRGKNLVNGYLIGTICCKK